jgi:hypothetical protein
VGDASPRQRCVFNVKKRSWKGGVQVEVLMEDAHVARLRVAMDFDAWLARMVHEFPPEEQAASLSRGQDALVQQLSLMRLEGETRRGLAQRNDSIVVDPDESYDAEVLARALDIRDAVARELDFPDAGRADINRVTVT